MPETTDALILGSGAAGLDDHVAAVPGHRQLTDPEVLREGGLQRCGIQRIGLDDVEAAFEKMHHGDVLRSVVIL